MSSLEHLCENAICAIEEGQSKEEWLDFEKRIHNSDGYNQEILDVVWEMALYVIYTYTPYLIAEHKGGNEDES